MKKETSRNTFQFVYLELKERFMKTRMRMTWRLNVLFLLTLYLILAVPLSMASPATFSTIDYPGSASTLPGGINPSGDVVGGYSDSSFSNHGFILSKGVFTTSDFPGATGTFTQEINSQGEIVGEYFDSSFVQHGFLLSRGE